MKTMRRTSKVTVLLALLLAPAAWSAPTGTAADLVPDDVGAFATFLNVRQQIDAFRQSNAAKRLWNLPIVQRSWSLLKAMPQFEQAKGALNHPVPKDLLGMLEEAVGAEIFVASSQDWAAFAGKLQEAQWNMMLRQIMAQTMGQQVNENELLINTLMSMGDIKLPAVTVGLKIKDAARANRLLDQLQQTLGGAPYAKQAAFGGGRFSVLQLSMSLIPNAKEELKKAMGPKVTEALTNSFISWAERQSLEVAVGHRAPYVLLSIGEKTSHLDRLGGGAPLANHASFGWIAPYLGDKQGRVATISYSSKAFQELSQPKAKESLAKGLVYLDSLQFMLPPGLAPRLKQDLTKAAEQIDSAVPPASEIVSIETIGKTHDFRSFSKMKAPFTDYGRPLKILELAGGGPFLAVAGSAKSTAGQYNGMVDWSKTLYSYWIEFGMPRVDPAISSMATEIEKDVLPLLKRLDGTLRTHVVPTLDAGQTLFLMDGQLRVNSLAGRTFPQPLPLPELALATSVQNGQRLVTAANELMTLLDDAVKVALKHGMEMPPMTLPRATSKPLQQGKMYFYPQPDVVPAEVLPHAYVSDQLFILSTAPTTTERMLQKNNQNQSVNAPTGSAGVLRIGVLIDYLKPWMELADEKGRSPLSDLDPQIAELIKVSFEIIPCLRSIHWTSREEGALRVDHVVTEIVDLGK